MASTSLSMLRNVVVANRAFSSVRGARVALSSISSARSQGVVARRTYADVRGPKESAEKAKREGVNPDEDAAVSQGIASSSSSSKKDTPTSVGSTSAFDIDTSTSQLVAAAEQQQERRTGARAKSRQTSQERSRRNMTTILGGLVLVGLGLSIANLGREWDTVDDRERFGSDPLGQSFFGRLRLRTKSMYTSLQAPAWEKLLPDPLPFPYARPYTLILDLDNLLIHSEWSRKDAWRTAKRPGLDYFLGYLSQWYEIVVFTRQPFYIVGPVLEKLDPDRRFITYQLFRESCRMTDDGKLVKDLSALNRDLSKVIALDTDAEAVSLQPENAVIMKKWEGQRGDLGLVEMIPFLEAIGIYNIPDVRQTIQAYAGKHIPTEHAARQRAIKEEEEAEWRRRHSGSGWLSGLKDPTASSGRVPKSWFEQERERFQQGYAEDQRWFAENAESLRQQQKEDQERQLREMKLSTWALLTGQGMKAPEASGSSQQTNAPAAAATAS